MRVQEPIFLFIVMDEEKNRLLNTLTQRPPRGVRKGFACPRAPYRRALCIERALPYIERALFLGPRSIYRRARSIYRGRVLYI